MGARSAEPAGVTAELALDAGQRPASANPPGDAPSLAGERLRLEQRRRPLAADRAQVARVPGHDARQRPVGTVYVNHHSLDPGGGCAPRRRARQPRFSGAYCYKPVGGRQA